jgi:hypothetical protein
VCVDRCFPLDEWDNWTTDLEPTIRGGADLIVEYRIGRVEADPEMEHYDSLVQLGRSLTCGR